MARPAVTGAAASSKKNEEAGLRDAEDLFCESDLQTVRTTERKAWADIESKKEELRQLVGARYRDLIESADSIVDMKRLSKQVVDSINTLHRGCADIHSMVISPEESVLAPSQREQSARRKIFTIGTLVKLLADTPEELWALLDQHKLLDAANRFRESEAVYGQLLNDQDPEAAKLLSSWPLLQQLWSTIRVFRPHVLRACRSRLHRPGLADTEYGRALTALLLLDHLTPRQAFSTLLQSRTAWLNRYLSEANKLLAAGGAGGGGEEAEGAGRGGVCGAVRDCLGSMAEAVQLTLCHVLTVFTYETAPAGQRTPPLLVALFRASQQHFAESGGAGEAGEGGAAWAASVDELEEQVGLLAATEMREACRAWVENCKREIRQKGLELLSHVDSPRELAEVQAAVKKMITNFEAPDSRGGEGREGGGEGRVSFAGACEAVLGEPVDVWSVTFSDMFLARAQQLVAALFARLSLDAPLAALLHAPSPAGPGPAPDLAELLWSPAAPEEGPAPALPRRSLSFGPATRRRAPGTPGAPLGAPEEEEEEGVEVEGAAGRLPAIGALVAEFDGQLRGLLAECRALLEPPRPDVPAPAGPLPLRSPSSRALPAAKAPAGTPPPAREAEAGATEELAGFVQGTCVERVGAIVGGLKQRVRDLATAIESARIERLVADAPAPAVAGEAGGSGAGGEAGASEESPELERALLIGRLCAALATSSAPCPSPSPAPPPPPPRPLARLGGGEPAAADAAGGAGGVVRETRRGLGEVTLAAFGLWVRHVGARLGDALEASVHGMFAEVRHRLAASAAWEEVSLHEGAPAPEGPEEKIRIPVQASTHVVAFLSAAVREVHRAGGYTLNPDVLLLLAEELCERVCGVYGAFLASHIASQQSQSRPAFSDPELLQLLFDVRFLLEVLRAGWAPEGARGRDPRASPEGRRSSGTRFKAESVLDTVQRLMDPIDWATYERPVAGAVQRYYTRSAVLFGYLVQLNRLLPMPHSAAPRRAGAGGAGAGQRYETNVLPLAKPVPRFTYLPVSVPVAGAASQGRRSAAGGGGASVLAATKGATAVGDAKRAGTTVAPLTYLEQVGTNALRLGAGMLGLGGGSEGRQSTGRS
eukprot:tig00001094_g7000.t1